LKSEAKPTLISLTTTNTNHNKRGDTQMAGGSNREGDSKFEFELRSKKHNSLQAAKITVTTGGETRIQRTKDCGNKNCCAARGQKLKDNASRVH